MKEDLDFLLVKSARYIPETVKRVTAIIAALEKRKKINVFTDLLSLCDSIYQETGKSCVVIFDEFHNLESMGVKDLYKEWSKLLLVQKTTMYMLVSSLQFKTKMILSRNLSLLFGNFEVCPVEPFDIPTSEAYLEAALRDKGINQGLKNFIVNFTGGYPFYLEAISESILQSPETPLADTLENLLFDASGMLNQRFSNYLKRFLLSPHSSDYMSILYSIAQGYNKIKDVALMLHKQKSAISSRLNQLLELDVITRSGDFLKINDRVFSYWLKFVYQQKQQSLTFDAKNQKALFRSDIEGMIEEFLVSADKSVVTRLEELLRLFTDDVVQIERKRLRLEHFREVKPLQFNSRSLREGLLGRSNDCIWILGFKREPLTEEDIAEFAGECKKYRHKLQQKIIIALKEVDTSARLKAMEEKILTWDVSHLNQLLDLYSKPRVIL